MRALALLLLVANLLLAAWLWSRPTDPAPATAPPVQASPLVLLAELPAQRAPAATDAGRAAVVETPAREPTGCVALGPFGDRDAVIAARDRLVGAGVQALPRAVDASQRLGYWVHTRPAASRDAAVAVIERLRRAGIRDFYVVTDGEVSNAVSLGVFGQPETAEQHAARLRAMGFDVVVGERRRQMTAWWLDFPDPPAGSPEAAAVAEVIRSGDALLVEPRSCD